MAESEQDKSELPTAYKLLQARRRGAVARGMDLGFFAAIAVLLCFAWWAGAGLAGALAHHMRTVLAASGQLADGSLPVQLLLSQMSWPVVRLVGFFLATMFVVGGIFEIVQTGAVFSGQPLKPDFSRLNPAQGLKRLFSARLLIETLKNVLKLVVYSVIGFLVIDDTVFQAQAISDAGSLAAALGAAAMRLLGVFVVAAGIFAVADQVIARRQFLKTMRMSRRDIRREHRDREGEPRLKQKRKQLHGEFARTSRSLRNLKGADVLIANPLHIAIALKYDPGSMDAPRVVSAGTNAVAQRLKRLALAYGIPVIEDQRLARELYRLTQLDEAIPDHCFAPVADIYNRLRRARKAPGEDQPHA
jgi:flagellar biosynthesis protein FlhB